MKKTIIVSFCCFIFGCSFIEPYPFPEKTISEKKISDCPNIEGKYTDVGEGKYNRKCDAITAHIYITSCSFYRLLFDKRLSTNDGVYFEIKQPTNDELNISIKDEYQEIYTTKMNKKKW